MQIAKQLGLANSHQFELQLKLEMDRAYYASARSLPWWIQPLAMRILAVQRLPIATLGPMALVSAVAGFAAIFLLGPSSNQPGGHSHGHTGGCSHDHTGQKSAPSRLPAPKSLVMERFHDNPHGNEKKHKPRNVLLFCIYDCGTGLLSLCQLMGSELAPFCTIYSVFVLVLLFGACLCVLSWCVW